MAMDNKNRFKVFKKKLIIGLAVVLVLALAYFSADNDSKTDSSGQTNKALTADAVQQSELSVPPEITGQIGVNSTPEPSHQPEPTAAPGGTGEIAGTAAPTITTESGAANMPEATKTAEVTKTPEITNGNTPKPSKASEPTNTPAAVNTPEPSRQPSAQQYCYLSIDCKNAILNSEDLNPVLTASLPGDGIILTRTKVPFENGDTVFDVLKKTAGQQGIELEYSTTPAYGGVYVEGIAELYEFDCGDLSGWMYTVNDVVAPVSASEYKLKNGDVVKWIYTCDLGSDI